MLIPEQTMLMIYVTTLDVTDSRESGAKPNLNTTMPLGTKIVHI